MINETMIEFYSISIRNLKNRIVKFSFASKHLKNLYITNKPTLSDIEKATIKEKISYYELKIADFQDRIEKFENLKSELLIDTTANM